MIKGKTIISWMVLLLWAGIGAGTIVLLVAAARKRDAQHCKSIEITIKGAKNNCFIDEKDILNSITSVTGLNPVGEPIGSLDLKAIQARLERDIWVKHAEIFFDNNGLLEVNVFEREPVARIFTADGNSFYIDSSNMVLPLSEKITARVPVFTNFTGIAPLSKKDSNMLKDIKILSMAIQRDSFRMAMIDQVDITSNGNFEMIPKIGNQLIRFGDAKDAEAKFSKLRLFYSNIMVQAGWNLYSVIDLEYKNQVVAKRRGADDKATDSLRTLQIMALMATNAEKLASDSVRIIAQDNERNTSDSSMIQQSIQRDERTDNSTIDPNSIPMKLLNDKPVLNSNNPPAFPAIGKQNSIPLQEPNLTPLTKPLDTKQHVQPAKRVIPKKASVTKSITKKPPILMPSKNDY